MNVADAENPLMNTFGSISILNFTTCSVVSNFTGHSDEINSISYSPNGLFLVSGSSDNLIKIWSTETWTLNSTLVGHSNWVRSVLFSPCGNFIASGSNDKTVRIWNFIEKTEETCLYGHLNEIFSISFSPNGKFLVSGSSDNSLIVWNLESERQEITLAGHSNWVRSVVFAYDGKYVISAGYDNVIRIWNLVEKRQEFCIQAHDDSIRSIALSPNGFQLASASSDCCVKVWDLQANLIFSDSEFIRKIEAAPTLHDAKASSQIINYKPNVVESIEEKEIPEVLKDFVDVKTFRSAIALLEGKYFFIQTSTGFDFIDVDNNKQVEYFVIKEIRNHEVVIEIDSNEISFGTKHSIPLNPLVLSIFAYQMRQKVFIRIPVCAVDTNTFNYGPISTFDSYFQSFYKFKACVNWIRKNDLKRLTGEYSQIFITQFKYTLLHFASLNGDASALSVFFENKIRIKADIFGKSPVYYSIMKSHQKCVELTLKFIIDSSEEDENELLTNLHSTRNDFLLIVQNASSVLLDYLNLLLFEKENFTVPKESKLPIMELRDFYQPQTNDFKLDNTTIQTPAVAKFTAYKIPVTPFTNQNKEALKTFKNCLNTDIFNSSLVKNMINLNWIAISNWAFFYSSILVLNILSYIVVTLNGRSDILSMIFFLILHALLCIWDFLQIMSLGTSYFEDFWNYIDICKIFLVFYWSVAGFVGIDTHYEDFLVAFLLLFRGLSAFRVIQGTRHYIHFILVSLSSIRHFIVVFFYSTFFFTVLFYVLQPDSSEKLSYFKLWKMSWALNMTADVDLDKDNFLIYISIFSATIINVILMLNMLISILGDSYDVFMLQRNIIDCKEKIMIILEVQSVLFWKNEDSKNKFLHFLCLDDKNVSSEQEEWQGKIIYNDKKQEIKIDELIKRTEEMEGKVMKSIEACVQRVNLEKKGRGRDGLEERFDNIENRVERVENKVDEMIGLLRQMSLRNK